MIGCLETCNLTFVHFLGGLGVKMVNGFTSVSVSVVHYTTVLVKVGLHQLMKVERRLPPSA